MEVSIKLTVVEHVRLKKCPFCDFVNIHADTITHHIWYTKDADHIAVDVEKLDNSSYILVNTEPKPSQYGPYISMKDLSLTWIYCLWCSYRDKIKFDLSLHFLEEHKEELLAIRITRKERLAAKALAGDWYSRFESPMEYVLDKAIGMAYQKSETKSEEVNA